VGSGNRTRIPVFKISYSRAFCVPSPEKVDISSRKADTPLSLVLSGLTPHGLGGLVCPDGEGGRDAGGDGAGHGEPVRHADRALAPADEGHRLAATVLRFDVLVAPACRVGDESDNEEHPGEGLNGAADGEDGAADAAAAADGQQGEQVGDDHESQSQHKCNDGAPPRVRVLVLVELCEEGLEVVGVWDALALEELLASGLRALDEEAHRVSLKLIDVTLADGVEDICESLLDVPGGSEAGGGVGAVEPAVGEERHEDHERARQRHHVPQHRPDRHDDGAHRGDFGCEWKRKEIAQF